ncbi:winged helix-turn-helix transcriptional regulator [Afifella pfennigii]|uniref:winged helix-turn-helix transcriptional regulator n=1 Tax=Afifella pfennigii TaxID=209897 RepID=UPI00047D42EF|nr:helix-turn-helix domain-containing protein [Afifella pfennigii]
MGGTQSYGQFCPVAMATEIVCTRWTPLILRELFAGSSRFNDLRKGLPRMSPTLLSKRLKELETAGIVERVRGGDGSWHYGLTTSGEDLKPVVFGLGLWGQRWLEAQTSLKNLDPSLLMWDMRRNLDPTPLLPRRAVIQILYPELPRPRRYWWLIVEGREVDLCSIDPGFDVDLHVVSDLRTMTAIWMGLTTVGEETASGRLKLMGDEFLGASMQQWLGLSPFAGEERRVAS